MELGEVVKAVALLGGVVGAVGGVGEGEPLGEVRGG